MGRSMTKSTKWYVRPAKTQISLGIRPVGSESSLSAWRKLGSWATHWAHSEDSGQTGRMPRLIWVFAGRTDHIVGFVMRWIKCDSYFSDRNDNNLHDNNHWSYHYHHSQWGYHYHWGNNHYYYRGSGYDSQCGPRRLLDKLFKYELRHKKTSSCRMRTTKAQITLRMRAVWTAPSLSAAWIV